MRKCLKKSKFYGFLSLAILSSGCSWSDFFGNGQDHGVLEQRQYRRVNRACSQMDLGSAQMSVQTVKSLVACLNSTGALSQTQNLLNRIDDRDLEPFVQLLNRSVLNDAQTIYAFENTYNTLVARGLHQDLFRLSSDLLQHDELALTLLRNTLKLLKSDSSAPGPRREVGIHLNDQLISSLQIAFGAMDLAKFRQALDLGLLTTNSPAFSALTRHLVAPRFPGETEAQRDHTNLALINQAIEFLRDEHTFQCGNERKKLGAELEWLLRQNLVFPVMDEVMGVTSAEIQQKVPRVNRLLRGLLSPQGAGREPLIQKLASSFHVLSPENTPPMVCLNGTKSIPDPRKYLIREMMVRQSTEVERYLSYEAPLFLVSLSPFCELPPGLGTHYQAMHHLVDSGVTEDMVNLMQPLYQTTFAVEAGQPNPPVCRPEPGIYRDEPYRPWIEFMLHAFADGGAHEQRGIRQLAAILEDARSRGLVSDALLVSLVFGRDQRDQISSVLMFLLEPRRELEGQSVVEVLTHAASGLNTEELYPLIKQVGVLLSKDNGALLHTLLDTARKVHYVNDVHPFWDLIQKTGSQLNTPENRRLIEALDSILSQRVVESDGREIPMSDLIKNVMQEWSTLSSNGEMQAMIESTLELFHRFAMRGQFEIHPTSEPRFELNARHTLSQVEDLPLESSRVGTQYLPCRDLDFSFSLKNTESPDFSRHLGAFLACKLQGGSRLDQGLSKLFGAGNLEPAANLNFLGEQISGFRKAFGLFDQESTGYLINEWMNHFQFTGIRAAEESTLLPQSSWYRSLQAIPYFTRDHSAWVDAEPIVKTALNVVGPIFQEQSRLENLEHLQGWAAEVLVKPEFPRILSDARELVAKTNEAHQVRSQPEFKEREQQKRTSTKDRIYNDELRQVLKSYVQTVECWRGRFDVDARVEEIIQEAQGRVNNHDLVTSDRHEGARMEWEFNTLKGELGSVLKRLKDPSLGHPDRPLLDATLNVVKSALGPEGTPGRRYTPEKLLNLFLKRALRVRPRVQYYKGNSNPFVVLDSDLDLLEKTLYNVDMILEMPPKKNLSMEFAREIGDAWGDLPADQWPDAIKNKEPFKTAYRLAARHQFADPLTWSEQDQAAEYVRIRPRTLKEAVEEIIHRPSQDGHSFNEYGFLTGRMFAWKTGVLRPNYDFSRFHGGEDLHNLTMGVVGLPTFDRCVHRGNFSEFDSEEFGIPMVQLNHAARVSLLSDYEIPAFPKDAFGGFSLKTGVWALKGSRELADMQGQLFNLWQSIEVLRENVPGSPANDDGGLLPLMRDLFFEVNYSNREDVLTAQFPAALGEKNQLSLMGHVVRLGVMHRLGQLLQSLELEESPADEPIYQNPKLKDPSIVPAMRTMIRAASSPELLNLTHFFLQKDQNDELTMNLLQRVMSAKPEHLSELVQIGIQTLATVDHLDPWVAQVGQDLPSGVVNLGLARGHEALDHFYEDFLTLSRGQDSEIAGLLTQALDSGWGSAASQVAFDWFSDSRAHPDHRQDWVNLLTSALAPAGESSPKSRVVAALDTLRHIAMDPKARKSASNLVHALERLQADQSFQALRLGEVVGPLLDLIQEEHPDQGAGDHHQHRNGSGLVLRQALASLLKVEQEDRQRGKSNPLNELMKFALAEHKSADLSTIGIHFGHKPQNIDVLLEILSQSVEDGQIVEFLKVIRRSLPEN